MTAKQKRGIGLWSAVTAILLAALIAGNTLAVSFDQVLSEFFGRVGETVTGLTELHFTSDYETKEEALEASRALARETVSEGTVLIKNDNQALPLPKGSAVSVFGMSSTLWMTLERIPTAKNAEFANGLEDYGYVVNKELRKFYNKSSHTSWGQGDPKGDGADSGDWRLDEVPQSEYTDTVKNSYAEYADAAIVVLTRGGGEGADLPRSMDRFGGEADQSYLELTKDERDMLAAIRDAGCFKHIIALLHSDNPMQMDFINEYGIDAVIWVGGTGPDGINALFPLIAGDVNPSGRLVDTFTYDNFSAPAMQNFGDNRFVDAAGNDVGYSYVNYAEGIYVGYKYYETRYEDTILGRENVGQYNYGETVAAPFGFGLSYTSFDWTDYTCSYDAASDAYQVKLTVTNTGSMAGKDVVEIYSQSEYTDYDMANQLEKASVNLVGYAKTKLLQPGESEQIAISVKRYDLTSYDAYGFGTYILEEGDYCIAAGRNAHDAVNNILAAKGYTPANGMDAEGNQALTHQFHIDNTDAATYSISVTGEKITNLFDSAELKGAAYLSRSNWSVMDQTGIHWHSRQPSGLSYATGTKDGISQTTNAAQTVNIAVVSDELLDQLRATGWTASGNPRDINEYPAITTGAQNGLKLSNMIGLDYDDPQWDKLLDQLDIGTMHDLYKAACYTTIAIPSIDKPITRELDGPAGVGGFYGAAQIVIAATWNDEIAAKFGALNGSIAILDNASGWYAPGTDTHRTPFSGRNFEYFSEDGFLGSHLALAESEAAQEKGLATILKHIVMNDQETNRNANGAVATFSREQVIREIYLKPFELPITQGGALGVMMAMNRIGPTRARSNYNLLVNLLRKEWGFKGITLTDYNVINETEESTACLSGGCDLQLYGAGNPLTETQSPGVQYMLRESTHHTLYYIANSLALNGYSTETSYQVGTPVYIFLLIGLDALVVILLVLGLLMMLYRYHLVNTGCTVTKKLQQARTLRIVYWAVVGVILLAALIVFFVYALPLLQQAFKIN